MRYRYPPARRLARSPGQCPPVLGRRRRFAPRPLHRPALHRGRWGPDPLPHRRPRRDAPRGGGRRPRRPRPPPTTPPRARPEAMPRRVREAARRRPGCPGRPPHLSATPRDLRARREGAASSTVARPSRAPWRPRGLETRRGRILPLLDLARLIARRDGGARLALGGRGGPVDRPAGGVDPDKFAGADPDPGRVGRFGDRSRPVPPSGLAAPGLDRARHGGRGPVIPAPGRRRGGGRGIGGWGVLYRVTRPRGGRPRRPRRPIPNPGLPTRRRAGGPWGGGSGTSGSSRGAPATPRPRPRQGLSAGSRRPTPSARSRLAPATGDRRPNVDSGLLVLVGTFCRTPKPLRSFRTVEGPGDTAPPRRPPVSIGPPGGLLAFFGADPRPDQGLSDASRSASAPRPRRLCATRLPSAPGSSRGPTSPAKTRSRPSGSKTAASRARAGPRAVVDVAGPGGHRDHAAPLQLGQGRPLGEDRAARGGVVQRGQQARVVASEARHSMPRAPCPTAGRNREGRAAP